VRTFGAVATMNVCDLQYGKHANCESQGSEPLALIGQLTELRGVDQLARSLECYSHDIAFHIND
jgi:hypothetical protein